MGIAGAAFGAAQPVSLEWTRADAFGGDTTPTYCAALKNGNFVVLSTVVRSARTDGVLSCYGPLGSLLWSKTLWNTDVFRARGLVATGGGDVYVVGAAGPSGGTHTYVARVSPAGTTIWAQRFFTSAGGRDDSPWAAVRDAGDNLYVAGQYYRDGQTSVLNAYAMKVSPGGNRTYIWRGNTTAASQGTSIAVNSSGAAAVGITSTTSRIWKLDASGGLVFDRPVILVANVTSVQIDNSGNVYLGGRHMNSSLDSAPAVQKLNTSGVLQWTRWTNFQSTVNSLDTVNALKLDVSGNIYAAGKGNTDGDASDFVLMRITGAGAVLASRLDNSAADNEDVGQFLDIGTQSDVYVAGGMTNTGLSGFMAVRANLSAAFGWERYAPVAVANDLVYQGACFNPASGQLLTIQHDSTNNNARIMCLTQPGTPVADNYTISRGGTLNASSVLANDIYGNDGIPVLVTPPSHGTVTMTQDGKFVYKPDTGFNGIDSFTYRITKPGVTDSGTVQVVITVT